MYNNWYSHPSAANSENNSSWVQEAGYQTDRTGFGFKPQSGAAMLASLDEKVADADSKLRDFMAEIESLDTGETTAGEGSSDMTRSSMPGFVSGGHVLPATAAAESEAATEAAEEPIVEPTTSWQHFLDDNTKHYYYWNSATNAVTWNLPQDYSEYLVRLKLYQEAIAAGRKTLPAASAASKVSTEDTQPASSGDAAVARSDASEATEEAGQEADPPTEIGPQLPANIKSKVMPGTDPPVTTTLEAVASKNVDETVAADPSTATIPSTGAEPSTDVEADVLPSTAVHTPLQMPAALPSPVKETTDEPVKAVVKSLGGIVGYESDSPSESEDLPAVETAKSGATTAPVLKALVAYDDSYTVNDDEGDVKAESVPDQVESSAVSGPQLPPESGDADQLTNGYAMVDYGQEYGQMYGEVTDPHSMMMMYDQYGHYQSHMDYGTSEGHATLASGLPNSQDGGLVYGPAARDVSYDVPQEAPLVFTGAPPPPPPPLEQAEEKSDGLSSMEISEFSSVIMEKLDFLDTQMSSLSKLQLLLVQLKTRLDDWQAGGLSKQYLIERLEETDALLEVCESESAPAGWKCNWSRKEKQYYYIHEITDEVSWSYPQEDVEAVKRLAERQDSKSSGQGAARSGTLSHLSQAIEVRTVDADLKALFLQKVIEKCTDILKESSKSATDDTQTRKVSPQPQDAPSKANLESLNEKTSKVQLKEHSEKPSKTKRPYPVNSDSSDELYKSKKSKHKQKTEETEKKHKKHSKHKKSKSSSKKSKQKKRLSRSSSSEEPGEVKPRKSTHKAKAEKKAERSPVRRVPTPDSSPDTKAARLRLSSRIFKLDHSGPKSKAPHHSSDRSPTEKASKEKIDMFARSSKETTHSPSPPNTKLTNNSSSSRRNVVKSPPPSKTRTVHSPSPKTKTVHSPPPKTKRVHSSPPKTKRVLSPTPRTEQVAYSPPLSTKTYSAASTIKQESRPINHRSPSPPTALATELPPIPDFVEAKNSDDEMDISSGSSKSPSPEKQVDAAASKSSGHIETEDDMESFLQAIQRDMQAGKSSQPVTTSKSLSRDSKLPSPISTQKLPPPKPKPESTAPKVAKELPTSRPIQSYSRAGAPVFYEAPVEKPPIVINAPVLYSATPVPTQQEPAVPNLPVAGRDASPIRFPEVSQATAVVAETSKPVKDKSKHKKSSKKGSKMPAALVQKWQKVQSEITTDIEKELQLKKELLN